MLISLAPDLIKLGEGPSLVQLGAVESGVVVRIEAEA
jgi:hypothetical protein